MGLQDLRPDGRRLGSSASTWSACARERLARAKHLLAESQLGALLCFDMNNIRYLTSTHIGTWAIDKLARFTLLPQNDEPILWDFGSAARHHQLYCPWLGERSRPGISTLRGALGPEVGQAQDVARKIRSRARAARPARRADRSRRHRAARPARAAGGGHHRARRPAADAAGARDQDRGRDHAAQHRAA